MAEVDQKNLHLPEVIVFGPPSVFKIYSLQFSSKFKMLKPWESPLPLPQYLAEHAQNTRVALCSGICPLPATVIAQLPSLSLVVSTSAGMNHIDLMECRRRGIAVVNGATVFSVDVADLAVGLLIDVSRKISAGNRYVRNGLWREQGIYPLGFKLGGKKVGIVGLGSIGLEVAKRLEAFGCSLLYHSRKKNSSVSYIFHSNILELAAASDVLVICCPLTEQTRHMINRDVLLALGKEGLIINIARGSVIDEKELVRCLQQREIAGAGLDVFENEPRVPTELFELDNVVLSPHFAVFTEESFRDSYELVTGNLEAFFSNKPLLSPATF
ncbi:glyoxylate/hydroxypyruvate reductase HPR3-like [Primulina tabacum]|uniref:glyoxylate/hydroxypyruvate reductase HPR3-like n=1 Tax=Primulina tabacum TaxID=48773 RepID=UPI003F5986CE